MEKIKRKIEYTQARNEIISSFSELADYERQKREWINPKAAHRFWDSIWFCCLDTLIESFRLCDEAYKQIGGTLYDEEEAEAIQEYCAWILELVDYEIGPNLPDEKYYNHAAWPKVVEGALNIRKLMARKNKVNNFWKEYYDADNYPYEEGQDLTPEHEKKYLE